MTIAVLHQKPQGLFYAIKLLNRRKRTEKRVRIKSLYQLCMLIEPGNVIQETSNDYISLYQLKTKHNEKAQPAAKS